MKTKIQIKNRFFGNVLFEYEKENNTVKDALLEAIRRGADLSGAYLREADLRGANLSGADLSGANLSGANLSRTYLREADLRGADLSGANLSGADLSGADLSGTYLREADLSGANLSGADLSGANLSGAYLYYSDNEIDESEIINDFEKNNKIKILESYINHDIYPSWNCFWKNGLIIRKWEILKEQPKEMTMEELNKILGYEVKIVEKKGCEE